MKKSILLLVGVVILSACQKKSEDAPVTFDQRVPEKLNFIVPPKGEMPSEAQLNEVQDTFQNKSKMVLPPGELLFPDEKLTTSEVKDKEAKLKASDANSYKMLKEIQSSCNSPKPTVNSNFPTDGQAIKAGDNFIASATFGITSKTNGCPLTSKGSMNANMLVEVLDQNKKEVGMSAKGGAKVEFLIQKPEYQRLLNSRGMIVDSNISGMTTVLDSNGKVYMSMSMAGNYLTIDKQIDYSTSVEMASKSSDKGLSRTEVIIKAEMKYPGFNISIVSHNVGENGKTVVSRVFLNGNELDANQQKKILNSEVPGIGVIEHSKILGALK